MGQFRSEGRSGGFGRGRDGGGSRFGGRPRSGGFGGGNRFGGRGGFDRDARGPAEMHDAICSSCGKNCQVPFRPSNGKPVFCSDCFRKEEPRESFTSSHRGERPERTERPAPVGATSAQLTQINAKLDKILTLLEDLEIVDDEADEDEPADADSEDADAVVA